jgi:hypothetical protein
MGPRPHSRGYARPPIDLTPAAPARVLLYRLLWQAQSTPSGPPGSKAANGVAALHAPFARPRSSTKSSREPRRGGLRFAPFALPRKIVSGRISTHQGGVGILKPGNPLMTAEPSANDGRRYSRLGKYEVLVHLASGGMAAVYKAVDVDLGREVALKILSPELAGNPALIERFQREARHIAKLHHRNIVKMYEFGEASGTYFLALEFVDGIDLFDYISRKGQLDLDESLLVLTQASPTATSSRPTSCSRAKTASYSSN